MVLRPHCLSVTPPHSPLLWVSRSTSLHNSQTIWEIYVRSGEAYHKGRRRCYKEPQVILVQIARACYYKVRLLLSHIVSGIKTSDDEITKYEGGIDWLIHSLPANWATDFLAHLLTKKASGPSESIRNETINVRWCPSIFPFGTFAISTFPLTRCLSVWLTDWRMNGWTDARMKIRKKSRGQCLRP